MDPQLAQDQARLAQLLDSAVAEAKRFLAGLDSHPAGATPPPAQPPAPLPATGLGAQAALATFQQRYAPWLSGSAGPRYFGFVTGGVTPAGLLGDWLTSTYDQNALGSSESIAPQIELDTLHLLRELFGLPEAYSGSFVTGATMANFVGLALGRQWLGQQQGIDVAQAGLAVLGTVRVFSGTPHASVYKALSMLGLGRASLTELPCLPGREAINVAALEQALQNQAGQPCLVVANAGTVNTVDFDDLAAIAALKQRYPFWLHVDAAFGGFAACSPTYRPLLHGLALADTITIDAHKWLNVPYDAAMQFTRHPTLQAQVFQNNAVYLGQAPAAANFVNLTPENSRRLRALPAWFTLMAYGRTGYAEIVERHCRLAQWLGAQIAAASAFELLAPVRLNGICFTLATRPGLATLQHYLEQLQAGGAIFLTPTHYQGLPALRLSITNWRTTQQDANIAWQALQHAASQLPAG